MSVRRLTVLAGLAIALVFALVATGDAAPLFEQKKLTASDAEAFDRLGYSVSISGDTAIVGAQTGSVAYVFGATPYTAPPPPVGGIAFDPDRDAPALPAVEAAPAEIAGAINGVRVFARIRPVAVAALSLGVAVALWWLRTRRA